MANTQKQSAERHRGVRRAWYRVKFGFDANKFSELADKIRGDINQIAALTKGSIVLAPVRRERQRRSKFECVSKLRDQSRRVFDVFRSRFGQMCRCTSSHVAGLELNAAYLEEQCDSNSPLKFHLLLYSDSIGESTKCWKVQYIAVEAALTNDER